MTLSLGLGLTACGSATSDLGEDHGNLLDSSEGLTLVESEHTAGWGRQTCTLCHVLNNIHLVNRTDIGVDIEAVSAQAIAGGNSGCATCHGTNGVNYQSIHQTAFLDAFSTCQECHNSGMTQSEVHTTVQSEGTSCTFCHSTTPDESIDDAISEDD